MSSEFVSRKSHSYEAVVGSYNRSMRVQRKRALTADQNRPLDHDSDRSSRKHLVCGSNQRPVATDVHGLARTCYLLLPSDCVTGRKREGKANSAPTFRRIEGTQALHCLSHRSSTKMNEASQRVTYFTEVEPATLIPWARSITRVSKGIGSRTST